MKLTLEQIRAVTVGALTVEEQPDGIHFHKCTAKQEAAWYAQREILGFRAETTTGIRLDFTTNSPTFAFTVKEGAKFEVHIDPFSATPIPPRILKKTTPSALCWAAASTA